jgi:hypothetical protein
MLTVIADTATTPLCLTAHVCAYAQRSHDVYERLCSGSSGGGYNSHTSRDSVADAVARYRTHSAVHPLPPPAAAAEADAAPAEPKIVVCACVACTRRFRVYSERLLPYDNPATGEPVFQFSVLANLLLIFSDVRSHSGYTVFG